MASSDVRWTAEFREDGQLRFRVGRDGGRLVAEWPGICVLRADPDGAASELTPEPNADRDLVEKFHRGIAQALIRHLEGGFTLHASAAALDGTVIACAGESQAGKSTTAAELVLHHDAALVADDTLALDFDEDGSIRVHPTERVSWLLPDARSALGVAEPVGEDGGASSPAESDSRRVKLPIEPPRLAERRLRLGAVVLLGFDDDLAAPRVQRVRGHDALERLVPSVVRFVLDEPERNRRELEQLLALINAVPIYELVRPRKLEELGATIAALRALARGLEARGLEARGLEGGAS